MSITIVSGFGRCGSSALMQMLCNGGMHAMGEYPYHEDPRVISTSRDMSWVDEVDKANGVIKILRPKWMPIPDVLATDRYDVQTIWLDRDVKEQAKSEAKFWQQSGLMKEYIDKRPSTKQIMNKMKSERKACVAKMRRYGPVMFWTFELMMTRPLPTANRVCEFLGRALDTHAMAARILPRGTACLPHMLEFKQMAERDHINRLELSQ